MVRQYSLLVISLSIGLLTDCVNQGSQGSSGGVIIDTQGVNMDAYYQDLH